MNMYKDEIFIKWLPLTNSIDLIESPINLVEEMINSEFKRILPKEEFRNSWVLYNSFDELFSSVKHYTNVPTFFYLIPTNSKWTALWNNSFLCNGYDSLCYNITRLHHRITIHWLSDGNGIFQSGTVFNYRAIIKNKLFERHIYCANDGGKWIFFQKGKPLSVENLRNYKKRSISERFNENILMEMLNKLEAQPWMESFYDFSKKIFIKERDYHQKNIVRKDFNYIITKNSE